MGSRATRGILQAFPISLHSRRVTGMSESERLNFALEQVETDLPWNARTLRGRRDEMLG